jgi:hypothetical protein
MLVVAYIMRWQELFIVVDDTSLESGTLCSVGLMVDKWLQSLKQPAQMIAMIYIKINESNKVNYSLISEECV